MSVCHQCVLCKSWRQALGRVWEVHFDCHTAIGLTDANRSRHTVAPPILLVRLMAQILQILLID